MKNFFALFLLSLIFVTESCLASTLTVRQNLSFGTLIPQSSSGNITISTAGAITSSSNVTVAPSGTIYYQGIVRYTPTILDVLTVKANDETVVLNNTTGSGSVNVTNIVVSPSSATISVLSPVDINIGGRMSFSSSAQAGVYTGTLRVTITGATEGNIRVNLPVTLTLWSSLQMSQVTPLSFGELNINNGSSVVRLVPQTGIRSIISGSGNVTLGSSPSATAGNFSISGQANTNVSVSLPSSVILTGNNGGTLTVNNFSGYPSSTQITLNSSGKNNLYVGADINIGTNQKSGTYTGTYNVTVNY